MRRQAHTDSEPGLPAQAGRLIPTGTVASIGSAGSANLATTVFFFIILRGVSLLGIDSGCRGFPTRQRVWDRVATDLKPRCWADIARTIALADLPDAFDDFVAGRAKGRSVVRIDEPG